MGCLHVGHLSLVQSARNENDCVIVTIFVNPTQFGPEEDFQAYPRDPARDLVLLEEANVDLVFTPSVSEVYPSGFQSAVDVQRLSQPLEGVTRPGHFRGVATVVLKLFNIIQPDRAYFGFKDYQQLLVVQQMVRDLNVPVLVVPVDTVRDVDGLAISSRNVYLDPEQRRAAAVLNRGLSEASQRFRGGERRAKALCQIVRQRVAAEPIVNLDYVSLADPRLDLREIEEAREGSVLLVAAWVGKTRLIDNITLEAHDPAAG